jgi:hypothetical protein
MISTEFAFASPVRSLRRATLASHAGAVRGRRAQHGAALIVGLVLLLALTVIGVSGMNMSTLELTMAGNMQAQEAAFQAAETGIDVPIGQGGFSTSAAQSLAWTPLGDGSYRTRSTTTCMATTPVPDIAFSMGTGSGTVQAWHFDIVSVGQQLNRNASSTHTQSFYVVGPAGGTC